MLSWIIQITIISIILIFLVHHLIDFFKSTLTVPKIKDLVNTPVQKYENMYNIINHHKAANNNSDLNNEYTLIDLLPTKKDEPNMKTELKNFLKSQLHSSQGQGQGTDIMALEQSNNSYSNY